MRQAGAVRTRGDDGCDYPRVVARRVQLAVADRIVSRCASRRPNVTRPDRKSHGGRARRDLRGEALLSSRDGGGESAVGEKEG